MAGFLQGLLYIVLMLLIADVLALILVVPSGLFGATVGVPVTVALLALC
jgi:hypothetical protein